MKQKFVFLFVFFLAVGMTSCEPETIEETGTDQMELFANDDPPSDEAEEDIEPNE